ncbi:Nuclear transport factor 2 [Linum perenne]
MAAPYPGPVSAIQVGSYFVAQYYRVLQQQPDLVHQFYSDASTMIRVDGDVSETATTMRRIHNIIMSLNFAAIEIKTINSIESWNGGVLVMVSGSVKTKDFSGRKNFVHTFFLAPQETGYFVLNDIFQFIDSEVVYQQQPTTTASESIYQQHAAPSANDHIYQEHHAPSTNDHIYQQHQDQVTSESFYQQHTPEDTLDGQLNASDNFAEAPVSDYGFEEEARDYVNSVHIDDTPVDKYSLPEHQLQHQQEFEGEVVVEETIPEETPSFQGAVDVVHEPPTSAVDEPAEEPSKKTWASILKVAKGPQSSVVAQPQAQPPVIKSAPAPSDWNHVSAPVAQQTDAGLSVLPEPANDVAEDGFDVDEGEFKSVYVRNLPSDITAAEIEQEFRNFGRISPDGVFVRNRKDVIGVCYAFVEFEDLVSVQNAIKSSPIQLAGRQVYIEERRPTGGIASRGGRGRGRGRGGYPTEAPRGRYGGGRGLGRSSNQDNGEYNNRSRGNGYPQRSTR